MHYIIFYNSKMETLKMDFINEKTSIPDDAIAFKIYTFEENNCSKIEQYAIGEQITSYSVYFVNSLNNILKKRNFNVIISSELRDGTEIGIYKNDKVEDNNILLFNSKDKFLVKNKEQLDTCFAKIYNSIFGKNKNLQLKKH